VDWKREGRGKQKKLKSSWQVHVLKKGEQGGMGQGDWKRGE